MLIIDRFEEDYAILEDGESFLKLEKSKLPKSAREGDAIVFENEIYSIDEAATNERRNKILERLKKAGL